MIKSKYLIAAFLSLFLPISLIACGSPAAPPAETGVATQESAEAVMPFIGEIPGSGSAGLADSAELPFSPAPASDSPSTGAEFDTGGIPVGYTEDGRPYRGNPDAPIVMEEFSDFQCPYCERFSAETLPGLLENQIAAGEVVLIYYDFPLNSIHPQAAIAANAARCAGEAGATAYWAMHDRLFVNVAEWSNGGANDVFLRYGEELGVAEDDFAACLDEHRYADAVEADLALGQSRGVGSTPSFFLNDQPVIGAFPLDYFNQAIAAVGAGEIIAAEPEAPPQGPTVKPTPATIVMDDTAAERGDPAAPVTIIEYTDYQCPYCLRHAADTLPRLITEMIDSGRVRYIVKDFPLDNIHPEARAAAVAARCAGEQDAYWEMHDELFARQGEWSGLGVGASDVFKVLAADISLDGDAFAACLTSGRHDAVIQANQDEGVALGVRGTPAFFIDGFPISGAQPYELFEYAVGLAEEGTLADAYVAPEQPQTQAQPPPAGPVEVDTEGSYSIGEPDAPVVIVEFTDYQCPFCSRHFAETYPRIKADYVDTGKVRYVFMEFPLISIHPQAQMASEAALCAGDQGAYLEMHDALFGRQSEWNGRDDAGDLFATYAQELGLDGAAFTECLSSRTHEATVAADLEEGVRVGVDGTPAFFLNGNFISGAQPYEVFQGAIDDLLAAQGS